MKPEDLHYQNALKLASKHIEKGRPESAAFLNWFLEDLFNLDDVDADDAICDGNYDQGIDGIYVSDIDQEIVLFQSKLRQNAEATLGDVALKEFAGSLGQFDTAEKAGAVAAATKNPELKKLLDRTKIGERIDAGYSLRGVFVTNAPADENSQAYLANHPFITLYDRDRIVTEYVDINAPEGVEGTGTLSYLPKMFGCRWVTRASTRAFEKASEIKPHIPSFRCFTTASPSCATPPK